MPAARPAEHQAPVADATGHGARHADETPDLRVPATGRDDSPPGSRNGARVDDAGHGGSGQAGVGCTAPQLRRFIKSRSWVPMHELRRRFAINGPDDDVTPVSVDGLTIFVGLPPREGALLGELLRAGDIGYQLSLDPCTPVVIGVFPMRPVPRH